MPSYQVTSSLKPTYENCFVHNAHDALLLVQAVINCRLTAVDRRPQDQERAELIKSGNVFIFDEKKGQIQRWTDGISWSPSRILGEFLIYREKRQSTRSGGQFFAYKRPSQQQQPQSNAAMQAGVSKRGFTPRHRSSGSQSSSQSYLSGSSVGGVQPYLGGGSRLSSSSSMNTSIGSKSYDQGYNLYGSLTNNEQYKEDGLLKKTISVPYRNSSYRLISYYFPAEVETTKLRAPSQDPFFANTTIDPELAETKNMKFPISLGGDFNAVSQYNQRGLQQHQPQVGPHMGAPPHLQQQQRGSYTSQYGMYGGVPYQGDIPSNNMYSGYQPYRPALTGNTPGTRYEPLESYITAHPLAEDPHNLRSAPADIGGSEDASNMYLDVNMFGSMSHRSQRPSSSRESRAYEQQFQHHGAPPRGSSTHQLEYNTLLDNPAPLVGIPQDRSGTNTAVNIWDPHQQSNSQGTGGVNTGATGSGVGPSAGMVASCSGSTGRPASDSNSPPNASASSAVNIAPQSQFEAASKHRSSFLGQNGKAIPESPSDMSNRRDSSSSNSDLFTSLGDSPKVLEQSSVYANGMPMSIIEQDENFSHPFQSSPGELHASEFSPDAGIEGTGADSTRDESTGTTPIPHTHSQSNLNYQQTHPKQDQFLAPAMTASNYENRHF